MMMLSRGLGAIQEAGKYTRATIEYTGLLSYGLIKLGGRILSISLGKVAAPVAQGLAWPFVEMTNMTRRFCGRRGRRVYFEEKFKHVDDKLVQVLEKLSVLEQRGVMVRQTAAFTAPPRPFDPGKQAFLRQLVDANKALLDVE